MKKVVVIGLSGGMDSATLLGYLLDQGYSVHCCVFSYGSKHNKYENDSARQIVYHYEILFGKDRVSYHYFNLELIMNDFQSALMLSGEDIPEGHYNDENMKKTVVPGRNLIFSSIMAGLAESIGAEAIALGVHSGDHHIYPDCRPDFIRCLQYTIKFSTEGQVGVLTPFQKMDKAAILDIGYKGVSNQVPYSLTRTCYKNQELSCGKCGSCRERLEAFEAIGIPDPIRYENQYEKE